MLKKASEGKFRVALSVCLLATLLLLISLISPKSSPTRLLDSTLTDSSTIELVHKPSNSSLFLEVAITPQKREKGLMFREKLDKDSGMFFIFDTESNLSFWMKNTSISLDIIFLDEDLKVTSFSSNTKTLQTSEFYNSNTPSMYVIEVLSGWALEHQVKVGDIFSVASIK